jgi:hypothetical protein
MRMLLGSIAAVVAGSIVLSPAASGSAGHRVFYLTTHPRQCLIATKASGKRPLVVPCSNAQHNLEVYAIGHGGWGHRHPPSSKTVRGIAQSVCVAAFQRVTGRPMRSNEGWNAFWPDPGAETARYGDKIICSYRTWPRWKALGSGWHVH